eukprot:COSAG01_NODE_47339_length_391_cov_1.054795_1_plen_74_part_01
MMVFASYDTWVRIEIDESDAFQKADRDEMERGMLTAVNGKLWALLPYFESLYAEAAVLYYGADFRLSSAHGSQH